MENKNIFSFDMRMDHKTVSFLIFLIIFPNLLGMVNVSTVAGFKIHTFQIAIIMAALLYGPKGGALAGLIGSTYSAIALANPYIAVGNGILGFFVGLFSRYGYNTVLAVFMAFSIQIPWLILTDYYLVNLPMNFIILLLFALAVSNLIWAAVAHFSKDRIKSLLT